MSSDFAPTFQLAACPACSSLVAIDRPFWRLARNTSAARHARVWSVSGCEHAVEVFGLGKLYDDQEIATLAEEAWTARVDQLFAVKVERWPELAVDKFKRELAGRNHLRGMTERLEFGSSSPAEAPPAPRPPTKPARVIRDPSSGETNPENL